MPTRVTKDPFGNVSRFAAVAPYLDLKEAESFQSDEFCAVLPTEHGRLFDFGIL
jgi:hypothetical protein